ncbi:hypothetical protein FRC09_013269, partial [Ceratobasidium sp. 395]
AVSFGAEATSHQAEEDAEDNGWRLAKHFKLHLHPSDMKAKHDLKLDRYLLKHTQAFFEARIIDGKMLWESYQHKTEIVIAHPNGWGIREQTFLRTAAVDAGITTNSLSRSRIKFVTEAEASVHFCIYHTNLGNRLQAGTKFAVCDAGGSTVDTTVYSVTAARPALRIQETTASACVQAGAIFVDGAARNYLNAVFTNASLSRDDVHEYTTRGVKDFENATKRNFLDETKDQMVEIAGPRVNIPSIRTRRGRMTMPGSVVKSFFDICVDEITASVDQQIKGADVSYILLVGGFGDSPFLRQQFKTRYEPRGCQVTLTNDSASKAVADGAIIWNNVSSVVGRAPRLSFGVKTTERYDPLCLEHRGREVYIGCSGHKKVTGHWSQIVAKGIVLDVEAVDRKSFHRDYSSPNPDLEDFETNLLSYAGEGKPSFESGALEPKTGEGGKEYWRLHFYVCIRFGGTELEAYLEWEEDGITQRGEATIIPE